MADNTVLNSGSGGDTISTDDLGSVKVQRVKVQYGTDGNATDVSDSNPLPIDDAGGSLTVDGTVTADAGTGPWPVTDNGGSLTVDGTVTANLSATDNAVLDAIETNTDFGAVTGGGTETGALRVTLANNSTGVVSVDDNGGSLTVDGTVTANAGTGTFTVDNSGTFAVQAAQSGSWTVDLGATDNAVLDTIETNTDFGTVTGGGTEANALRVTLANNSTGVVTVDDGGSTLSIDDGGGAITVDGTVTANLSATDNAVLDTIETNTDFGAVTGGGTETGALRVTLANDSTGVISIDDGGNTITVDGTVTANLSATDNTVLDNIDTNTTRGSSHYRNIDANAEAAIKGSAGTLHWIHAMNLTSSVAYLHLYDATTGNVTPGTTTPDYTFALPTSGDTNGAGFTLRLDQEFANAITLVVTTTTNGSTGDPGTNGVIVNAGYS